MVSNGHRTVVLGFDALDARYLERYAEHLPAFETLRSRGVAAPLESTHPPWTGSAWPSMYTGCDPSEHGVYGFFQYDGYPNDGRLVSRQDVDRPALWDYCSHLGRRSIVVNVPVTHPADPINGILIPGYLATEDAPAHPPDVEDRLEAALGEPARRYSSHEVSDDSEAKLAGYLALIDQRGRVARHLLETESWEFAFVQVQKTDAVFHNFDSDDAFRAVYEAADRVLEGVLESVGEDVNVVVCSDHGIGPVTGYSLYVNELLRQHDFLVPTAQGGTGLDFAGEKTALTGDTAPQDGRANGDGDDGGSSTVDQDQPDEAPLVARAAKRVLDRTGITPATAYNAADRVGLGEVVKRRLPESIRRAVAEGIDWRRSKAYCTEGTRLGVRINLEGREPAGVVAPEVYETVRDDLIELLSAFETPDGEPAFELVCRCEEVYDGPHTDRAPDILFRPTEMNHNVKTDLYGTTAVSIDVHDHKREGVFLAAGPDIDPDWTGDPLSLTDVAPVTMALLGCSVPETMSGHVPPGLLTAPHGRAAYDGVSFGTAHGRAGDTESVTNRLEDLGYL